MGNKLKVLMVPHPDKISGNKTSGIDQVVVAYARHLPEFGIELALPDEDNFDLIACHAGVTGRVNDVSHLHGMHWSADYDAPTWEYRVNERIVEAVRYAKQITVPSDWVAETIRRDLRVSPTVIPHGIDWADWQHNEPRGDYVLWNKNRADEWVCDARPVLALANKFTKAHFVTTLLPKNTSPQHNVNAIGVIPHDQMKKLIQSALVYLSTTKETFGIGILEAMAAGVPVLGYGHGGILDLVEHGVNGFLVEPGDMAGLGEGLAYCIRHHKTLGDNGREMARVWTWERVVQQVAEVYRKAAQHEAPTVGVVIPVYNKPHTEVRRAAESVVQQTYGQVTQIVLVDDGSEDDTVAQRVVDEFKAIMPDIKLIRQNNQGVAVARNNGIAALNTKYICCLDSDDWLEPEFMSVCVQALERDRSLGIAYTGLRWHKPDGTTGISEWPGKWNYDGQLVKQNQVPTCNVFRRVMWQRLGGYRQRYAPRGCGAEDAEFWLRAGAYGFGAAKVSQEPLFHYSFLSGYASGDPEYREPDWLLWHPWTRDKQHPFASYAKPERYSHPVRAYDDPAVSVIIPVGPGHEKALIDALDSLEAQTFRNWECIVVWDREDHAPVDLMAAYPYVNWRKVPDGPSGAGVARNLGVNVARAPFLLFLDADDWLYPEAIKKLVNAWNSKQKIIYTDYVGKAIVGDPRMLADDLQGRVYHYDEKRSEAVIGYKAFDFDCEKALLQPELPRPYIWCNVTALIPTSWHNQIGGFDENMESWEDVDYHWRMARAGYCYHRLEEELMVYRFYTGSRRDEGLQNHKSLVQYIKQKYESEGDPVGCRKCGGNKSSARSAPVPAAPLAPVGVMADNPGPDVDFVRARLVDHKRGEHQIYGTNAIDPRSGRRFDYGWHQDGDILTVHKDDVWTRDRRTGQLVMHDSRFIPLEEKLVEPPEAAPVVTPPPEPLAGVEDSLDRAMAENAAFVQTVDMGPISDAVQTGKAFDPQLLPGVNAKTARAMLDMGFIDKDTVLEAGVDGLVAVPGIGEKTAEKIIRYLSQ